MKHTNNTNRKGDFAEYYAVTWLWDNGDEVFQNSGCSGPVDIIAMSTEGELTLIDVKTLKKDKRRKAQYQSAGGGVMTEHQKKLGVKFLGFHPDTRQLRFIEHKE